VKKSKHSSLKQYQFSSSLELFIYGETKLKGIFSLIFTYSSFK